jgi:hypothetical protein
MWATMQAAEARVSVRKGMPSPCIASDLQCIYRRAPAHLWPHYSQSIWQASIKQGQSQPKIYLAFEHHPTTTTFPSIADLVLLPVKLSELSQIPSKTCNAIQSTNYHLQS